MEIVVTAIAINCLPGIIAWGRGHNSTGAIWTTLILTDTLCILGGIIIGISIPIAAIMWFVCLIWSITGNTRTIDENRARMIAIQIKQEFKDR